MSYITLVLESYFFWYTFCQPFREELWEKLYLAYNSTFSIGISSNPVISIFCSFWKTTLFILISTLISHFVLYIDCFVHLISLIYIGFSPKLWNSSVPLWAKFSVCIVYLVHVLLVFFCIIGIVWWIDICASLLII